jgi:excisionase family DNA binding protein
LLSVQELADLLQVPPKTIYAWRYKGIGPVAVPIGKYLRFRPEDVTAWLEARTERHRNEAGHVIDQGGRKPRIRAPRRHIAPTP